MFRAMYHPIETVGVNTILIQRYLAQLLRRTSNGITWCCYSSIQDWWSLGSKTLIFSIMHKITYTLKNCSYFETFHTSKSYPSFPSFPSLPPSPPRSPSLPARFDGFCCRQFLYLDVWFLGEKKQTITIPFLSHKIAENQVKLFVTSVIKYPLGKSVDRALQAWVEDGSGDPRVRNAGNDRDWRQWRRFLSQPWCWLQMYPWTAASGPGSCRCRYLNRRWRWTGDFTHVSSTLNVLMAADVWLYTDEIMGGV